MEFLRTNSGVQFLIISFVFGIILIAIPLCLRWEWDHGIIVAIGTALFIAPIVAFGIELWMTQRIVQDVFRAAFGYSMPPHFKDEISRIADQKLICMRHVMWVNIERIDDDDAAASVSPSVAPITMPVRVNVIYRRTIKNIGPYDQEFPRTLTIDD
jgi:hypothetical protein